MDLDPRYLQAFFAVAREGSFSRAAAALHRTQPAISYQVQQLEQQLGTRLFDRTTRRLTLTAAGAKLQALCASFFGEFERLVRALEDGSAAELDPLRIASVSGFGRYVLFPLLGPTLGSTPYTLHFPTAEQVFHALEEGTVDVGFVYLPRVSSRLATTPVWREELVLVTSAAARRAPFPTLRALEDLSFVTYDESDYVFGKWFEAIFGRPPRKVHSRYCFEELEEVVETVAAGGGCSIVPDFCAAAALARGRVRVIRHPRRRAFNALYAVTRAGTSEHPGIQRILQALHDAQSRSTRR